MLGGLRRAGQTWLGKLIVAVLFCILIVSFAIWGIGDIFRGGVRNTVASVGSIDVSAEAMRNAYQQEVQRLSRGRRSITPEQARALGLDAQVLNRLVGEATLDAQANAMGLAISDDAIARSIRDEAAFRGANGQFDITLFQNFLRQAGLSEAALVREQRGSLRRAQIVEALAGDLQAPLAAREAVHRYTAERREAALLTLPATAAGEIPAPNDEELKAFYEDRRASFRAPEARTLNVLALGTDVAAQAGAVPDEEARARYEQVKAQRFAAPERRTVQQVEFPSPEAAEAGRKQLAEGATFEALAAERGVTGPSLTLGTFTRPEMIDPAVAAAAFALPQGEVSAPVQGRFGTVLLRVTAIEPEQVRPYEAVAGEIKAEIAQERSRGRTAETHDRIEDLRAAAKPLADIARELSLPLTVTPPLDRGGHDRAGAPVPLPERDALLNAAFSSDVGVDNEPIRTAGGGYVWYEVAGIEPARDRTLDEVRDQVLALWRSDQTTRRLQEQARALVQRLDAGESPDAVAASLGLEVRRIADLERGAAREGLTPQAVAQVFATPVAKAGTAPIGDGRAVFKVTGAAVPPFVTTTREAAAVETQLASALTDDILSQYVAQLRKEFGVTIHPDVLRRAVGGDV